MSALDVFFFFVVASCVIKLEDAQVLDYNQTGKICEIFFNETKYQSRIRIAAIFTP